MLKNLITETEVYNTLTSNSSIPWVITWMNSNTWRWTADQRRFCTITVDLVKEYSTTSLAIVGSRSQDHCTWCSHNMHGVCYSFSMQWNHSIIIPWDRPLSHRVVIFKEVGGISLQQNALTKCRKAKLPTDNFSIRNTPWVVTNCAPLVTYADFDSALTLIHSSNKTKITISTRNSSIYMIYYNHQAWW